MATCPECGSNTADNDVFCPYCGISLPTAIEPAPTPEAEDPYASTIMITGTEPADLPLPNIPHILADNANTSGNIPKSTSEYVLAEASPEGKSEGPEDAAHANGDEANHASGERRSDEETLEDRVAGEGERGVDLAGSADMLASESTSLEPEVYKALGSRSADEILKHEVSDTGPAHADDELFRERPEVSQYGIARPSVELESPVRDSTFDSVKIMNPSSGSGQDDVDTRIHHLETPPEPPASESVAGIEAASRMPSVPGTAQNIGRADTDGSKGAKLKPLSEGTVLNGRYEIVRRIGGGGMGAVYLASDNNLGGVLRAVKEMVQAHIEEEQQEKSVNDFKRESMILSTLDHSSIPTIYDYFYDEKEGRFYLVMKYISGGDLSSRLRAAPAGKIEERTVTEWAIQITDVLDYLHNQPSTIVYRDLKPSNIMLDGNSGRIMLIDFGIARSISQKEEKGVTAVGTMGYAPPELFSGNVEPRSDIYSLGSTMFHLLTGADPQSNPLLIFDFQKNPRPRQINPQLSDQMERILMRAVEYNADARFSNAAEMRVILEDHLTNLKASKVSYGVNEVPAAVSLANQAVFCGFCGQRIVATDLFCAFCGSKQPLAQQGVHSEIYSKASATAKLVIEGTSELATPAFTLQKDENLLGRRDPMSNIFPEVDLSKFDPQTKISRRHARIWREGGRYMVEDLGSSNGTILASALNDAVRLPPRHPHLLSNGDKLRLGDTTLHFMIG